jgi:hypothetical protein
MSSLLPTVKALREELRNDRHRLPPVRGRPGSFGWNFPSYRELLGSLGHNDGLAECIEVAVRDFLQEAKQHGDAKAYLLERAKHHRIVVNELDDLNIVIRAANSYLVITYQHLEAFLYKFLAEATEVLGVSFPGRADKESALDWALRVLPGGTNKNRQRIWRERYLLLNYYRHVRNAFLHDQKSETSTQTAFEQANRFRLLIRDDYKLDAPNAPNEITMDDFLLFTRLIKYLATDLCRMCIPNRVQIVGHATRLYERNHRKLVNAITTKTQRKAERKVCRIYSGSFGCDLNAHVGLAAEIVDTLRLL